MIKDRRAASDEAIQATAPSEELKVSDRPVLDLGSTMNAVYNKAGMYFNPQLFKDLAAVSDDIHDTRRNANKNKFYTSLNQMALEQQEILAQTEQMAKMEQDKRLADLHMKMSTDITSVEETAMRNNESTTQNLLKLKNYYDKVATDLAGESAYMGDNFRRQMASSFNTALTNGIKTDWLLTENRSIRTFDTAFDLGVTNIFLGRKTLDQTLQDAPQALFPLLNNMTDVKDEELLNKGYNMYVMAELKKVERMLKAGSMSIDDAKSAIFSTVAKYQIYDMVGPDENGQERTVTCRLSDDVWKEATNMVGSLDNSKAKAQAVYTQSAYFELTDKDITDKNDWINATYFKTATFLGAQNDWMEHRTALVQAAGAGSEDAVKQLYEIDNHWYSTVRPYVVAKELLSKSLQDTGNFDKALSELESRKNMLGQRIAMHSFPDIVSELTWTDKDNMVYLNLGYPEAEDSQLGSSIQRNGVPAYGSKETYYKRIYKAMDGLLQYARSNPDALSSFNQDYYLAQQEALGAMSPTSLIREDKETGTFAVNVEGVMNAAKKRSTADMQGRIAGGSMITGTNSTNELKSFNTYAANLSPEARATYLRAVASTILKQGNRDIFTTNISTQNRTPDEIATANDIAMWGYLDSNPSLKEVSQLVYKNKQGGVYKNPTIQDLESATGKNWTNDIQSIFNDYNISEKYQPALRHTIVNALMAYTVKGEDVPGAGFTSSGKSKQIIKTIIESNFTKKGTFKYISHFKGIDADALDNMVDDTSRITQTGLKAMGLKDKVSANLDAESGTIQLKVNSDAFMGVGAGGPLAGSGKIPFSISITNKPAGMDDTKYYNAQKSVVHTATSLAGLTRINGSPKMMDWAGKVSPNTRIDDIRKWGIKGLYLLNQRNVQDEWLKYYNSNFTDRVVQSAPVELKKFMVDTITKSFKGSSESMTKDQINHMVDFLYSRMQTGNTIRVDVPQKTFLESKNIPAWSIDEQVKSTGWTVTFSTKGQHAKDSLHYFGRAADIGLSGGFYNALNPTTRKLDMVKLEKLSKGFLEPNTRVGNITRILTSYPELISGRSNDPAYAKYRNMKNSKGEPLFQYAANHSDHFHVEFSKQMYDTKTGKAYGKSKQAFISEVAPVIMNSLNSGHFGYMNIKEAEVAAAEGYGYRPNSFDSSLTGRSVEELSSSPVLRATAWAVKYAKGKNALGSAELAQKGMNGLKFKLRYMGPNSESIKIPDREFTLEEVIKVASKGIGSGSRGTYYWVPVEKQSVKKASK